MAEKDVLQEEDEILEEEEKVQTINDIEEEIEELANQKERNLTLFKERQLFLEKRVHEIQTQLEEEKEKSKMTKLKNRYEQTIKELEEKLRKEQTQSQIQSLQSSLSSAVTSRDKLQIECRLLQRTVEETREQLHDTSTARKVAEQRADTLEGQLHDSIKDRKHERKYNILIYGIKQKQDENIWQVVDNFFVKDLGIEKFKAESFPLANAHRIPSRAPVVGQKRPDAIIVRFMHYEDKQVIMQNAYKVANKKIRIVDDLPVIMKEARNDLAKAAFKIRNDEKLQTRIKVRGIVLVLETRLNSKDVWNTRKTINCVR
ncbi:Hypothetical predicted protein [Mytilus galloprovincialis]|uniref:Uncharacterized protein n=1 Tax=Mytilus galloprovincialis TaxID=29158 RepID=A0A8B6D7V4_MYTGA|nr:Hypothetical predicted protein [Mytilus galloprovincialis]